MNSNLEKDILSRRTFAIISHPDAGKTTITEKLLLFGGAIRDAGTVKGKKQVSLQHRTGWRSKNNVEFRLLHLSCNSIIMALV